MNTPWHKWSERKPKKGENIIAVYLDYIWGNPAYRVIFIGGAIISLIESNTNKDLVNLYWLELPKGKEEIDDKNY